MRRTPGTVTGALDPGPDQGEGVGVHDGVNRLETAFWVIRKPVTEKLK